MHKMWSIAATSRWTHLMESLKQVFLGCISGRLMVATNSTMTSHIGKNEKDVDAALERAHKREKEGGDATNASWAKDRGDPTITDSSAHMCIFTACSSINYSVSRTAGIIVWQSLPPADRWRTYFVHDVSGSCSYFQLWGGGRA